MKNIFYLLFVLFSLGINSANASIIDNKIINQNEICVNIDLGDISMISNTELSDKITSELEINVPSTPELTCSVTVTGSVGVGENKIEISVTVSGPCSEVKQHAVKIMKEVKQMLR